MLGAFEYIGFPEIKIICVLFSSKQLVRIPSLPVVIPVAQIGLMGSVYCTVALALERFLAVCYPFLPRR